MGVVDRLLLARLCTAALCLFGLLVSAPARRAMAEGDVAAAAAPARTVVGATCGDAVTPEGVNATDALYALRTVVGSRTCHLCVCDADGSGAIAAVDALRILRVAVGIPLDLLCPACVNGAPTVDLGAAFSEQLDPQTGAATFLAFAIIGDDALPAPPALTYQWSLAAGPNAEAGADFDDPTAAAPSVTLAELGTFTLRLEVSDGELSTSDTVDVTVEPATNTAPSLEPIADKMLLLGDTLAVRATAYDYDTADEFAYSLTAAPEGATLDPAASGLIRWPASATGDFHFTVRATDSGGLYDETGFDVTVLAANRRPMLAPLADDSVLAGATYRRTIAPTDPDGAATVEILEAPAAMALEEDDGGATLVWPTTPADVGVHAVKLRAVDDGSPVPLTVADVARRASSAGHPRALAASPSPPLDDVAVFLVTVLPNTAPTARDDEYSVAEGATLTVAAPGVLGNDTDPDGDELVAALASDPALGSLSAFADDGGFTFEAPAEAPDPAMVLVEKWRGGGHSQLPYALPLVGDVDENGTPDLVMSVLNNTHVGLGGADGAVVWNAVHSGTSGPDVSDCADWLAASNARVLADVDDDGHLEYVVPSSCSRDGAAIDRILAYDHQGNPKWISPRISLPHPDVRTVGNEQTAPDPPLYTSFSFDGMNPSVARLAPDAAPTILVRAKISYQEGSYYSSSGTYKSAGCRALTGLAEDEGQACRATLLVSGMDGSVERVLTAPNPDGSVENYNRYPWREHAPFAADLEGDGSVEILSGSEVWKRDGEDWTLAWQAPVEPAEVATADLDGDGIMEVIHLLNRQGDGNPATRFGGFVVFDAGGNELRRLPVSPTYYPGYFTVADVDGDGSPEFVNSSQGYVQALRSDGRVLWIFALPAVPSVASTVDGRSGVGNNQVYDLDGDGVAEVLVVGIDGLHVLDGPSGIEKASYLQPGEPSYAAVPTVHVADFDADGHAEVAIVSRRGSTNCNSTPPDCNIAAMLEAEGDDWLPAPAAFHQTQFRPGGIGAAGRVEFDDSVGDTFRTPEQLGAPTDRRAAGGTSFTYVASDGAADSEEATVFVTVEPENLPPVITSLPPSAFLSVSPYTRPVYTVTAYDPDPGDSVHFELVVNHHPFGAIGLTIDADSGELSVYTGSCGSYGGPCQFDDFLVVVAAVDSLGARTEQAFTLAVDYVGVAVPDVVGQDFEQALETLGDAGLRGKLLARTYASEPAETVIAQGTPASTVVAKSATVALTVSSGPMPVVVPNVVGLPVGAASEAMEAAGFDVDTALAYSASAARGVVLEQTPEAGAVVAPAGAELVVSLGSGIFVRLERDYTTANRSVAFEVVAVGTDGVEMPFEGASLAVEEAAGPHLGSAPSVAGDEIVPAADSRGTWRLVATDTASGRSGSAELTIVQPGDDESGVDVAAFADFSERIAGVLELLLAAREAAEVGDDEALEEATRDAVLLWRAFDQSTLRLSSPFSPEAGLPPRESDMAGFGVSKTFEDRLHVAVLEEVAATVDALVAALRDENASLEELAALLAAAVQAAQALPWTAPTEYGSVAAQPEYAVLAAHLLPDWMDALMNDLGATVGLEPLPATELDAGEFGAFAGFAEGPASASAARRRPRSTLAEQATAFAVNTVLEHVNVLQKFHKDVMKQAFSGAILVSVAAHLRAALQTSDLVEVVAGVSLSFRRFYAPYTFVEGFGFDAKYPQLNEIVLIGPDTAAPGIDLFEAIKEAKFDTLWASAKTLAGGMDKIKAFVGGADEAYANGLQRTHHAETSCVFTTAPDCVQLVFPNGFYSVYSYEPPPGFATLVGLPLPIVTLVRSSLTGEYAFATPPFIPYKPGQEL